MVAQLLLDKSLHVSGDFLVEKRLPDLVNDFAGRRGTDVSEVQLFLQDGKKVLIDSPAPVEERRDAGENAARLGEPLFNFAEESAEYHEFLSNTIRRSQTSAIASQ